jgi:hypothetical protein
MTVQGLDAIVQIDELLPLRLLRVWSVPDDAIIEIAVDVRDGVRLGVVVNTSPWRVLITVDPRLLADVLARRLARPDLVVAVADPHGLPDHVADFDLVVTTGPAPLEVKAPAVLYLPRETTGQASLRIPGVVHRVDLPQIESLVRLFEELCPRR